MVKQTVLPSEIILVDGGSTDDTLAIIRDFFTGLEKSHGFKTATIIDIANSNYLPQGCRAADGGSVTLGREETGSHGMVAGSGKVNNSSLLPGRGEANDNHKKSGDTDYLHERLVFESILNGVTSVKIYDAPGANISSGRNIAIRNADSKFICVSDAGCRLSRDWIEEISKYFAGTPENNAAVDGAASANPGSRADNTAADGAENKNSADNCVNAGTAVNHISGTEADHASDTAAVIVAGGYNFPYIENFLQACLAVCVLPAKNEITPSKYMPSSRNISFAKAAWEKAGGYPQHMDFGEDMRFNFNLKALGYKIKFNPDALVYWNLRNSPAAIFRQFFRYAKGDAIGRMYSHRHLIRFSSVFLLGALILAGVLMSPWFLIAILLLFAAFNYRPYFRINYFLNNKNCCVFTENKKTLLFIKIKTILCIPAMLPFIETAKLAGFIYGLFIRKNF